MNRNKVAQKVAKTPKETNKSPLPNYIPPASIKPQNDDKIIKLLIKTYK